MTDLDSCGLMVRALIHDHFDATKHFVLQLENHSTLTMECNAMLYVCKNAV